MSRWPRDKAVEMAVAVADRWKNVRLFKHRRMKKRPELPDEIIALKILRNVYSIQRREIDDLRGALAQSVAVSPPEQG